MNRQSQKVSVVVLSYNRPDYLRQALGSVLAQTYESVEVIVVDNLSPASDEVARVVVAHGGVELIRNASNLGYAGGMNRGIERASGKYVYLTEDDITLDSDCIRRLVEYMEANREAVACSPLMFNKSDGTIRYAGGEIFLGGVYRKKVYGVGQRDLGQFTRPFETTYLDGACVFARAAVLREVGGFREDFFMYGESAELFARVLRSGRKSFVVPRAKVYHFDPPPGDNTSAELEFHRYKNFFALYLLHAAARSLPEFFARYVLLGAPRALAKGGGHFLTWLKALLWVARSTPGLLRDRRRCSSARSELLRGVCTGA